MLEPSEKRVLCILHYTVPACPMIHQLRVLSSLLDRRARRGNVPAAANDHVHTSGVPTPSPETAGHLHLRILAQSHLTSQHSESYMFLDLMNYSVHTLYKTKIKLTVAGLAVLSRGGLLEVHIVMMSSLPGPVPIH